MRIGQLAKEVGATTNALRFYEEQGLLPTPDRTPAGYRDYPASTVNRIDFIHRGQAAGLTLAQIRGILQIRDRGQPPCHHVRDLLAAQLTALDAQMAELASLRASIAALSDRADTPDPAACDADTVCRYL